MSAWTPAAGMWLHARLLRPPGRSEGPVVMLHGLGVSSASLGPLATALAERHAVAVIDLPGFGRTAASRVLTTAEVAEAVAVAMERRSLRNVTLVGHSWGCHVAAMLAARHPGLVWRLVMLSPGFDGGRGGAAGLVLRLAADAPLERPSLLAGAVVDYLHAGPRRVIGTLREATSLRLADIIEGVEAPFMVVRGSRDPLATARWAATLAARARVPATVAEIPRAAHGLGHDAPVAVARAIEEFLARAT
ncbi:MAG TPA: alpha/beta hydrolase [Miltoncostaeaceae bacterium]|nr:alpha/beta hydrolase [Miltoncostaeaceae bacterium]